MFRSGAAAGEVAIGDDDLRCPDGPEQIPGCREFRISDAMILVAGAALALSAGSHLLVLLVDQVARLGWEAAAHVEDMVHHWPIFWARIQSPLRNTLSYGFQVAEMFLVGMTPAFIILRLRRPRPPMRALPGRPGTMAALALVFGLLWGTGGLLAFFPDRIDSMNAAAVAMGCAVAAGWTVLVVGRKWSPEPGWVDRLGRILGWTAIVSGFISVLVFRI